MMRFALPITVRLAAVLAPLLLLPACNGGEGATVEVVAIGAPASPFEPGGRLSPPAQLLRGATAQGLVSLDEQGQVIPAVADRWIVADDGLSYIFRLRAGAWPDGSPISAESARIALRQAIAALRGTPMGLDLAGIEDIRPMTARVIELRLSRPQPEFLLLLAQPELGLLRKGRGAGPMQLVRDGTVASLTPIDPEKLGMPAIEDWSSRVRKVRFTALPAGKAIERFNQGELTAVLGGTMDEFPLVDAAGLSRGAIQLDPVAGLFGLVFVHGDGFLSQPANREALAMAIDRDSLVSAFGVGGWTPTTRIVTPGTQDDGGNTGERWSTMNLAARRAAAVARIAQWRGGKAETLRLRIALPDGPGATRLFSRLAGDFRQVGVVAVQVGEREPADLRLVDAVARYQRVNWFLNQLNCASQRGLCSADADRIAAQANAATDSAAHAALLTQAVAKLTEANVFIPFGPPIRWSLVRGEASGFVANRLGYHPLMPLALRPK